MHAKILYNQRRRNKHVVGSEGSDMTSISEEPMLEDDTVLPPEWSEWVSRATMDLENVVESEHSEYIISIARGGEKKNYFESRYNLSKDLGIISVDIRKKTSSTIPSDISTNRKNQLSHPQIGDTIYIKNVKNPKKSTYCVGTIVKPFEKISNISESFNNKDEIKSIHTSGLTGEKLLEKNKWFDTMLIFEYQCEVSWTRKDISLEKDSDMWKKLHPNGRTTVRKC